MLKIFECFAGYGGWSFGLKKAGISFDVVGYSEVDKYAIQCYEQNHKGKNYGDITKINPKTLPDFDLLCASPPCQSFSIAGKGLGKNDQRGRLFENTINIMKIKQPKFAIYENVKGLTFKTHKEYFNQILNLMKQAGYRVYWKILNTKEHGIPQNRERVFIVCIRSDITLDFKFPEKEELKIFLKDILEENVDEKYYLSNKQIERLVSKDRSFKERFCCGDTASTLCSRDYKDPKCVIHNCLTEAIGRSGSSSEYLSILKKVTDARIYDAYNKKLKQDGTCPTLSDPCHNNIRLVEPKIIQVKTNTKRGYDEAIPGDGISLEQPNSKTRRGRVQNQISSTLQTNDAWGVLTNDFRIRKLTPKECFRLQGFLDDGIDLSSLSNTQKYKLAGNGLSINVIEKLMNKLIK